MSGKKRKIYNALVDGATDGLTEDALFDFVKKQHPEMSGKNVVRASALALRDKKMRDKAILQTILSLAIKHKVEPKKDAGVGDISVASAAKPASAGAKKNRRRETTRLPRSKANEETSSPS